MTVLVKKDKWYISGEFLFFCWDTYGITPEFVKSKLDEVFDAHR